MDKPVYLYITPFFPSPESWRGGFCLDAAKALVRDGRYDVRVLTTGRGGDYEWDGIKVLRMRRLVAPCGLFPFLFAPVNNCIFRRKLRNAGIDCSKVAVCHVNTFFFGHYAAYFKRLAKSAKAIVQIHTSFNPELRSGRAGLVPMHADWLYLYYRRVLRGVDLLAFVSETARRTFGRCHGGAPEGETRDARRQLPTGRWLPELKLPRWTVLYNGIDTALFSPRGKKPHDGFVIGYVANFDPLKDHMTLLKSAGLLKDRISGLKVRLVGSGPTLEDCRNFAERNGLGSIVSFEREGDHRAMPDFYRSLDLFVFPSRLEGFPCSCVESWACGTPVLFCKGISFSEVLSDEERERWEFRPQDAEELSRKILAFRENRWEQKLDRDLDINHVWSEFLDGLE